ncbi:hypothetical protein C0J52_27577 [Blattella germanica]|nr:hypothetical protein C0J52_27577 [Blattella germanica]
MQVAKLFSYTWTMGFHLCKGVHYLQNVSAICSVLTLTAMSIERYYAIVHPMKAKYMCTISQARKIVLGIWIASFLLAVPNLISQIPRSLYAVSDSDYSNMHYGGSVWFHLLGDLARHAETLRHDQRAGVKPNWRTTRSGKLSTPIQQEIAKRNEFEYKQFPGFREEEQLDPDRGGEQYRQTGDWCPSIRYKASWTAKSSSTTKDPSAFSKVIKMLVAVVVLFVLCWAPLLIMNVLYAYEYYNKYNIETKNFHSAFTVMAYSNR